jgi:23S rRNA (guanosine2251-2'-O)-methyltransferase
MTKNRNSRNKSRNKQGRRDQNTEIASRGSSFQGEKGTQNQLWLFGNHAVYAALINPERTCHRLLLTADAKTDAEAILAQASENGLSRPGIEIVDRATINQTLSEGSVHQGIAMMVAPLPSLALEDICQSLAEQSQALVVIIDQGTDPRNIGAVMRSASAFGAAAVIVQDRHAPEATGVLAKAASGALETLPLVRVTNLSRALEQLNEVGFWSVGLAGDSDQTLDTLEWPDKTILVLGSEGKGMRRLVRENCDFITKIPMTEHMESLNLSNAAAIALYEIHRNNLSKKQSA